MEAGQFLQLLWHDAPIDGAVTLWLAPPKGTKGFKESVHLSLNELGGWDEDDEKALLEYAGERDVYCHAGLRRLGLEPGERGGRKDVIALCGFTLDFDLRGGVHKAADERLPTEDDLPLILGDAPDPTLVVESSVGGGLHFWWLFEAPWLLPDDAERARAKAAYKAFQEPFRSRAEANGFQVDSTAGIERQWRLPGTLNQKPRTRGLEPSPVTLVHQGDDRIPIPSAAVTVAAPAKASTPTSLGGELPPVADDDPLAPVRRAAARVRPDHPHRKRVEALLRGESIAPKGERNDTLYHVVSTIAWLTPARSFSAIELAELFRPTLTLWAAEPDAEKTLDDELEVVATMFESAIDDRARQEANRERTNRALLAGLERSLRVDGAPLPVSAPDDPDPIVTVDELARRAIVQHRNSYYVFAFSGSKQGTYVGPFIREELMVQLKDLWEDAPDDVFQLVTPLKSGEGVKLKTEKDILVDYGIGVNPDGLVARLDLQESYLDIATRTFHVAPCPMRVTEARFDPLIDEWLRLLGGESADKLLNWLACVPKIDRPLCALYGEGDPGVGKGLLANGLARLWRVSGPSSYIHVSGAYNADMFACPFILLDEGLPKESKRTSAYIRNLVATTEHTFTQKYLPSHKVIGCIRMLIAANNDRVLGQLAGEDLSEADMEALSERFLHIRFMREAADWIREQNLRDRTVIDAWLKNDLLAKHTLWLAQNREVAEGKRFLTDGEATEIHRALITKGEKQGYVLEWLARFALNPDKVEKQYYGSKKQRRLALCGNGQMLVNTQAIVDCWTQYHRSELAYFKISPRAIGQMVAHLSHGVRKLGARDERLKYHLVNFDNVRQIAEELQLDVELMEQNVLRENDFEPTEGPRLKLVRP